MSGVIYLIDRYKKPIREQLDQYELEKFAIEAAGAKVLPKLDEGVYMLLKEYLEEGSAYFLDGEQKMIVEETLTHHFYSPFLNPIVQELLEDWLTISED